MNKEKTQESNYDLQGTMMNKDVYPEKEVIKITNPQGFAPESTYMKAIRKLNDAKTTLAIIGIGATIGIGAYVMSQVDDKTKEEVRSFFSIQDQNSNEQSNYKFR